MQEYHLGFPLGRPETDNVRSAAPICRGAAPALRTAREESGQSAKTRAAPR